MEIQIKKYKSNFILHLINISDSLIYNIKII